MDPAWNAVLLVAAALCAVWLVGFLVFRGPDWARILALCVGSAVAYGIVHDQITARVSIEYFTIGHPRLFATDDPTPHALAWGVIATWWVGLLLGIPLAIAARRGARPKLAARDLLRPIGVLLVAMARSSEQPSATSVPSATGSCSSATCASACRRRSRSRS